MTLTENVDVMNSFIANPEGHLAFIRMVKFLTKE